MSQPILARLIGLTWWALGLLHGIDLPDLDGRFLHDDEQVEQWLEEFAAAARPCWFPMGPDAGGPPPTERYQRHERISVRDAVLTVRACLDAK
jgi:hypothetical protein